MAILTRLAIVLALALAALSAGLRAVVQLPGLPANRGGEPANRVAREPDRGEPDRGEPDRGEPGEPANRVAGELTGRGYAV